MTTQAPQHLIKAIIDLIVWAKPETQHTTSRVLLIQQLNRNHEWFACIETNGKAAFIATQARALKSFTKCLPFFKALIWPALSGFSFSMKPNKGWQFVFLPSTFQFFDDISTKICYFFHPHVDSWFYTSLRKKRVS